MEIVLSCVSSSVASFGVVSLYGYSRQCVCAPHQTSSMLSKAASKALQFHKVRGLLGELGKNAQHGRRETFDLHT